MKLELISALGLAEASSEADVLAAVSKLQAAGDGARAERDQLVAATGAAGAQEAIGRIEGYKAGAAELAKVQGERAAEAKVREAKEREGLIAQGRASGQLSPQMIERWVPTQSNAALAAFLETAPPTVARSDKSHHEPTSPRVTPDGRRVVDAEGRTWEQLSMRQKHQLTESDPALAERMAEDAERHGDSV